jgi:hypothetical protein
MRLAGFIFLFICISTCKLCIAQPATDSTVHKRTTRFKFEPGIELMLPYDAGRQIQTISANFLTGFEFFKKWHLSVLGGITTTYAYGNITQWDQNFHDVVYKNEAFGAGPVFLVRAEPIVIKKISISLDISSGIIIYTSRFPYGGDYYNFMSRLGASFIYRINDKFGFSISGKWMHVSNGQGLGSFNPAYEGAGMSVQLSRYF